MKKSICTIISVILLAAMLCSNVYAAETFIKGDTDNDGIVTAKDARLILRASVALEQLNETQVRVSDFDNNGVVTAADARAALRKSVGLVPIEEETVTVWLLSEVDAGSWTLKFTFDENYFVPEQVQYDNNGNTILSAKNTYDENGNIYQMFRYYEGDTEKIDITLDENGNWQKVFWYINDNMHRSYDYSFDKNGNMLSETEYISDGSKFNHIENTYDSDGKLLKTTRTNYFGEETVYTDEYTYDADNKLIAETSRIDNELFILTEYTYDAKGNILTEKAFNYYDDIKTAKELIEYTCDADGNILTEVRYSYNAEGKKEENIKIINTYDEHGNILTVTSYVSGVENSHAEYKWISAELYKSHAENVLAHFTLLSQ